MKKRTSPIWKLPSNELKVLVASSDSLSKVLKFFGLCHKGRNSATLKQRLNEENIDYSHIALGLDANKGRRFQKKVKPLNEVMIKDSKYNRGSLKRRLLSEEILENKCSVCGLESKWHDKLLVMVLDHINGVANDHRLENLRLLCPNCNSQTLTFAGKNVKKKLKKIYNCIDCGRNIVQGSLRCYKCSNKRINLKRRKVVNRPSKDVIISQIKELGCCGTARLYGVSDNAVRKWLK